jgi:hypothetical protein
MTNLILCCKDVAATTPDSINPLEIFISAIVGIITGVIASWIFAYRSKLIEKTKLRKQFEPIAGKFIRWWKDDKVTNRVFVRAIVKYISDNKFSIEVHTYIYYGQDARNGQDYESDHLESWTGEIVMDTLRSGTIVWEQTNPMNGNNGFKRIIVDKDLNGITLVGESESGFGVERFTEREQ